MVEIVPFNYASSHQRKYIGCTIKIGGEICHKNYCLKSCFVYAGVGSPSYSYWQKKYYILTSYGYSLATVIHVLAKMQLQKGYNYSVKFSSYKRIWTKCNNCTFFDFLHMVGWSIIWLFTQNFQIWLQIHAKRFNLENDI